MVLAGRQGKRGARGARGLKGARGAVGPPGPAALKLQRADVLGIVDDQFREIRSQLDLQVRRTAQIQQQLDIQQKDTKAMREELEQVHTLLKQIAAVSR